ncbi:MAG TPA: polysaccharide biosynthesis C-terminal domain-containing protein [Catenuloplanes sp.]
MTATRDRPVGGSPAPRSGARGGLVGVAGAIVSAAAGFVLTMVIVRSFGPTGSGAVFTAIGLVSIVSAVCCLGADTGLVRALSRTLPHPADPTMPPDAPGDAARVLVVAVVPAMVVAVSVAAVGVATAGALAPLLLDRADADGRALLRLAYAGVPLTVAVTLVLAALRAARPIGWYVAVQAVLLGGGRPVLVAVAVAAGGHVLLGFGGWLLPGVAAAAVALALLVRPLRLVSGAPLRPLPEQWRTFWGFALPRAVSAAIDASGMWIGVLLTSALAGPAQAGVFAAVGRYVLAGLLVMHGLRVAIAPQLSRLFAQRRAADAVLLYRRTTGWIVLLSWPGYLLLAVFGPGFLRLFGDPFRAGATPMAVLATAMLVNVGVGLVQTLLLMGGDSRGHLLATVAGLAVNVTACLLLIPRHGALGAAIAWAFGIVVENALATVVARRKLAQPLGGGGLVRVALAVAAGTGVACAVGVAVAGRGLPGLGVAWGVGAVGGAALLANRRVRATLGDLRHLLRAGTAPAAVPR